MCQNCDNNPSICVGRCGISFWEWCDRLKMGVQKSAGIYPWLSCMGSLCLHVANSMYFMKGNMNNG